MQKAKIPITTQSKVEKITSETQSDNIPQTVREANFDLKSSRKHNVIYYEFGKRVFPEQKILNKSIKQIN